MSKIPAYCYYGEIYQKMRKVVIRDRGKEISLKSAAMERPIKDGDRKS